MSGSVTRRKISSRLAPSVAAASSNRVSRPRSAPSTVMTRNGIATNASATTTPGVVNGSVMPNQASRYWPTMPRRPNASSSAMPPTTGGSTSGTVTSARASRRPGNSARASSHASGTPTTNEIAVAAVAVTSESRSASRLVGRGQDLDQARPTGRGPAARASGRREEQQRERRRDGDRPRRRRGGAVTTAHGAARTRRAAAPSGPGRRARRRRTPARSPRWRCS